MSFSSDLKEELSKVSNKNKKTKKNLSFCDITIKYVCYI